MFNKKAAAPANINHITDYQLQLLDAAERARFEYVQEYGHEQRAALETVAQTVAGNFWDEAVKAGHTTMLGPELATGIIADVRAQYQAHYTRGYQDGLAQSGVAGAKLLELRTAHQADQRHAAELEAARAQLVAQVTQLQAEIQALTAAQRRHAAQAGRRAAAQPTPEKWRADWGTAPAAESVDLECRAPAAAPSAAALPPPEPEPESASDSEPEAAGGGAPFTPAAPEKVWPEWFAEWLRSLTFYHARVWVQILGETGEPLRPRLSTEFGRRQALTPGSGGEKRALADLKKRELLAETLTDLDRRTYGLLSLTERGLDAYRLLFGTDPAPPHYPRPLALHKSAEHVLLILLTHEVLERAGYQVERYPEPVPAGELGTMYPDLVAYREGRTYYIEAETDAGKNDVQGAKKWRRIFAATGGRVYVAVTTKRAYGTVSGYINLYAKDFPEVQVSYLVIESAFKSHPGVDV